MHRQSQRFPGCYLPGCHSSGRHSSGCHSRRRGIILITILVAILLIGVFLSLGLQLLVSQRAHLRRESVYIQGTVLADSAIQRAKKQLSENPQFAGEIWEISKEALEGGGVVEIKISPFTEQPEQRRISIQVTYPRDSSGVRIEKSTLYKVPVPRAEGEE